MNQQNFISQNYIFEQNIYFSIYKEKKRILLSLLNFSYTFIFHPPPFQCLSCISCYMKNFYYILDSSHHFADSFFIFKENTLKNLKQPLQTTSSFSVNFTKWSNTLKQFVGSLPTNCLSVFAHFVGLALKGLIKNALVTILASPTQTTHH